MHWLDVTILVVLAIGAIFGARSGLLWQVARLVTFGVSLYVCIYYHQTAQDLLAAYLTDAQPLLLSGLAYVATFLAVYLLLYGITLLLERGLRRTRLKTLDRILGAAFGFTKAALLIGAILMGLAIYPTDQTDAVLSNSLLSPVMLQGMRAVTIAVPQEYKDELNASLERIKKEGTDKAGRLGDEAARRALEEQLHFPAPPSGKSADR
jgi:membrane protein required for colicin V production